MQFKDPSSRQNDYETESASAPGTAATGALPLLPPHRHFRFVPMCATLLPSEGVLPPLHRLYPLPLTSLYHPLATLDSRQDAPEAQTVFGSAASRKETAEATASFRASVFYALRTRARYPRPSTIHCTTTCYCDRACHPSGYAAIAST